MKTNHVTDVIVGREMKNRVKILLLVTLGLLLIFDISCKKDYYNLNFELLTSTIWIRTYQCGGSVDDSSNFTIFKPDGESYGEFYGLFSLNWSLKENGKTLVIGQTEYVIEKLTSTILKLNATTLGCSMTFEALASVQVTAYGVTDLTKTSANLLGSVATKTSAVVSFEYGVSKSYGSTVTPADSFLHDVSDTLVECKLTGLLPETTYHYRIKAVNSSRTFYSKDLTFRTCNIETVSDYDGNIYNTVTIGTQVWMAENLKTTKYRNGDPIPNVTDSTQWINLSTGAYCNYNNDVNNANIYGRLYNGWAVGDSRKIAPTGWHVASDDDWTKLTDYLGVFVAGNKIKESGPSHWGSLNCWGDTNESGFTALPSGVRENNGEFVGIGALSNWWSSTKDTTKISIWDTDWYSSNVRGSDWSISFEAGLDGCSVRCVKDN
jgi:Fibrobacter succinogenes major domain (Fib_succ_major).